MLFAIAALASAWVGLLIAAPILPLILGVPLYGVGAVICHQLSERSFHLAGAQLPVCARCLGIYAGAAVVMIVAVLVARPFMAMAKLKLCPTYMLMAGAAPTVVTVVLEWAGLWQTSNMTRAIAGVPLGAAAGALLAGAVATLHYGRCPSTRPRESSPPPAPI